MTAPPALENETARWLRDAEADYRLCREFARRYGARLGDARPGRRVGWELFGHVHCALLLPDSLPDDQTDGAWYLYYVFGESLFRRSAAQRAQMDMLLMAESTDDWAALLRQALHERVFDVRCTVTPDYINAFGETELAATGFVFTLEACAPGDACVSPCRIAGTGATPEDAARDACRYWLHRAGAATTSTGKTF
jgi:hypothetical protein